MLHTRPKIWDLFLLFVKVGFDSKSINTSHLILEAILLQRSLKSTSVKAVNSCGNETENPYLEKD